MCELCVCLSFSLRWTDMLLGIGIPYTVLLARQNGAPIKASEAPSGRWHGNWSIPSPPISLLTPLLACLLQHDQCAVRDHHVEFVDHRDHVARGHQVPIGSHARLHPLRHLSSLYPNCYSHRDALDTLEQQRMIYPLDTMNEPEIHYN